MTGSRNRLPLVLGLVTAVLVGGAWLLVTGPPARPSGWTPDQGTLAGADRDALAAPPVDPGAAATGPDPAVDFADPGSVAGAYVRAAYSLRATDAGHTNRRALPYAAPASTPGTVGVLALGAPPPGRASTASVTDVTQVSGEPTGTRRGYLVGYQVGLTGAAHGSGPGPRQTRFLLLVRQFDGRWLVAGDSADAQVGEP